MTSNSQPKPPGIPQSTVYSSVDLLKFNGSIEDFEGNIIANKLTSSVIVNNTLTIENSIITGVNSVNGVVVEAHASRHAFNGEDPLSAATSNQIMPLGPFLFEGTLNNFPRSDHVHAHGIQPGGSTHSLASSSANGFMPPSVKIALDQLGPSSDLPENVSLISQAGIGELFSRSNHVHAHGNQLGDDQHTTADSFTEGFMSASDKIKLDNITPSDANPQSLAISANPGISDEYSREDHVHPHGDQIGGLLHAEADTSNSGFMSVADRTKLYNLTASDANPENITEFTPSPGISEEYSREDHAHGHGDLGGGALHSIATEELPGFISANDTATLSVLTLNDNVFDVEKITVPNQPYGYLKLNLPEVIPNNQETTLVQWNNITETNISYFNGIFTIEKSGVYSVVGTFDMPELGSGLRYCYFKVSEDSIKYGYNEMNYEEDAPNLAIYPTFVCQADLYLSQNATIQFVVYQNTGSSKTISSNYSYFTIYKIL